MFPYRTKRTKGWTVNYYEDHGQQEPFALRNAWWTNPLGVLILVAIGVATGWSILGWAVLVAVVALSVPAFRQWRRTGRRWNWYNVVALALVMVFLITACSATYTSDPGPTYPPTVVGMHFATSPYDTSCVVGLLRDGSAAVLGAWAGGAVGSFVGGEVADWIGYGTDGSPTLANCWNELTWNGGAIQLYYQCAGTPVLDQWFNTYNEITAFVHIPVCYGCNVACQGMANQVTPWRNWDSQQCVPGVPSIDWRCQLQNWPLGNGPAAATVTGPQPLPNDYALSSYPPQPPPPPPGGPGLVQSQWQAQQLSNPLEPAPGPHATQ